MNRSVISKNKFLSSGLCCLALLYTIAPATAANWPAFRGPTADGIAANEKAPTHFSPSTNLLWKAETPAGHSSPVIWNGKLFLTAAEDTKLSTLAFDCASGKKLWEQTVVADKLEKIQEANSHAASTPVTDGQRLYVYFGSFGLLAYDFAGKEVWRKPLPMPKSAWGTGTSPILTSGKLVLFLPAGKESHLLLVNPETGAELSQIPMPEHNNTYATPVGWQEDGKNLVGMVCAGRFTAFNLAEGKAAWWIEGVSQQACSTPVVCKDSLVISAAGVFGEPSNMTPPPSFQEMLKKYGKEGADTIAYEELPDDLLFVDRQASGGAGNMTLKHFFSKFAGMKEGDKLNEKDWGKVRQGLTAYRAAPFNKTVVMSVRTGGKQDATASQIQWKETKGVPEVPSPLVWHDRLYLIRSGGLLVCRNLENGKLIFEERIDAPGAYFASPVLIDGRLYVASDRGTVTVLKAGDALDILAHNDLGESIYASPAVSDHTLFLRSSTHLWAFAEKRP